MPLSNPLLADIEEDYHQLLLEKGNLPGSPLKKAPAFPPHNLRSWAAVGYELIQGYTRCKCCRADTRVSATIFLIEETRGGEGPKAVRRTALNPRSLQLASTLPRYEDIILDEIEACPDCLETLFRQPETLQ